MNARLLDLLSAANEASIAYRETCDEPIVHGRSAEGGHQNDLNDRARELADATDALTSYVMAGAEEPR